VKRIYLSILSTVFAAVALSFSASARADYWFKVADASQIQYLIDTGHQVYLRNLNQFDSSVLGCCYNYWLDLSVPGGQAAWATLLARIQAQQPIWIYITSQTAAGQATVWWGG
jgi:hypothetical protein